MGYRATLKVAKMKLCSLGNMHGHCVILNLEENMMHMYDDIRLNGLMEDMLRLDADYTAQKKGDEYVVKYAGAGEY